MQDIQIKTQIKMNVRKKHEIKQYAKSVIYDVI